MAQSADQASVIGVITVQHLELLVDKVEKKARGIALQSYDCGAELGRSSLHRRTKIDLSEWLQVRARLLGLASKHRSRRARVVGSGW